MSSRTPVVDVTAASTWIFPVSPEYPVREYQVQISEKALFFNTLVCLPTGLGKTLIAAVVIYNYFRWFPEGNEFFFYVVIFTFKSFPRRKDYFLGPNKTLGRSASECVL